MLTSNHKLNAAVFSLDRERCDNYVSACGVTESRSLLGPLTFVYLVVAYNTVENATNAAVRFTFA